MSVSLLLRYLDLVLWAWNWHLAPLCAGGVCLSQFFVRHYFCPSLFLSVTILKNPYKTKTNKTRILFFLWKVPIIGGVCHVIYSILPLLERALRGNILVLSQFCMSQFWKILIKQKLMKQGYFFFLWKVPTTGEVFPEI